MRLLLVAIVFSALDFTGAISQGTTPKSANRDTVQLHNACVVYVKLKDEKTPTANWKMEDALAVGLCKGFFRGYMSASAEVVTKPDQDGRIRIFKISEGTTYDQAIRLYVVTLNEKPVLMQQDAGVVIMASLQAGGLATMKNEPQVYIKKH